MLFLQVVIEGVVERKSWGDIAVDDIKILDGLNMADCKGEHRGLLIVLSSTVWGGVELIGPHHILRARSGTFPVLYCTFMKRSGLPQT